MEHNHKDKKGYNEKNEEQHSMVCNDQLFYAELKIAAEEAERDQTEQQK